MQKGYWEDAAKFEFDGVVTAVTGIQGGLAVRFEKTYFYPESGGQLADGGIVGGSAVLDAQQDDQGPYVVLAQGTVIKAGDIVPCSIDIEKRLSHSQLHTAQHILSRLLENRGIRTLSFHMTEEQASIEIGTPALSPEDISELEDAVERVIWSCLPVQTLLVSPADLSAYNVRKVPELAGGPMRLVRIGELDTNPCGGTHVASTGEIGSFVVTGVDKVRGNARLYFAAGRTATAHYRREHRALGQVEQLLTCGTADVVAAVGRLQQRDRESGRQLRNVLTMAVGSVVQEATEQISRSGVAAVVLDWVPVDFARTVAARMDAASGPFCIVVYPTGDTDGQFFCTVPVGKESLLGFFGSQMKELYAARMGGSSRNLQGKIATRVLAKQLESLLSEQ